MWHKYWKGDTVLHFFNLLFSLFCLFWSLTPTIHYGRTVIQSISHQSWTWIVTALEYHLFLSFFFWGFLARPFLPCLWYVPLPGIFHGIFPYTSPLSSVFNINSASSKRSYSLICILHCRYFFCDFIGVTQLTSFILV